MSGNLLENIGIGVLRGDVMTLTYNAAVLVIRLSNWVYLALSLKSVQTSSVQESLVHAECAITFQIFVNLQFGA